VPPRTQWVCPLAHASAPAGFTHPEHTDHSRPGVRHQHGAPCARPGDRPVAGPSDCPGSAPGSRDKDDKVVGGCGPRPRRGGGARRIRTAARVPPTVPACDDVWPVPSGPGE